MTEPTPPHGCMIDGQPATPVLVSEYNDLVARVAEAEAASRRALKQRQEMAEERYIWQQRGDRAEAALNRVRRLAEFTRDHVASARDDTALAQHELACAVLDALDEPGPAATQATETAGHVYLSTGCLHGDHAYCKSMTGLNGSKRPGECKHCGAKCQCGCHATAKEN